MNFEQQQQQQQAFEREWSITWVETAAIIYERPSWYWVVKWAQWAQNRNTSAGLHGSNRMLGENERAREYGHAWIYCLFRHEHTLSINNKKFSYFHPKNTNTTRARQAQWKMCHFSSGTKNISHVNALMGLLYGGPKGNRALIVWNVS